MGENLDHAHWRHDHSQQDNQQQCGICRSQIESLGSIVRNGGHQTRRIQCLRQRHDLSCDGGYLHKETGTKLRGSYGTGFRAPTINQLFFPGFGNPNLKPEKSKGLDVALDQSLFNDRVLLSVGYFWTRYQNLILSVFDPGGVCSFTPVRFLRRRTSGKSRAEGVEASAKVKLIRDQPWIKSLDLQFQYTYTSTENLTNNADTRLPQWPLNQWSAILSYQPIEALRANLEGRFVGQRFNDTSNVESLPSLLRVECLVHL